MKLLDFGLAKLSARLDRHVRPERDACSEPLTARGTIVGTLQYMSPEQLEGREADQRADIFAFGAVLYEMLTGLAPSPATARRASSRRSCRPSRLPSSQLQPLASRRRSIASSARA